MDKTRAIERSKPLYHKLADALIEAISKGTYCENSRLPSEAELAETYGVGRGTVREAVKALTVAGIVESTAGRGTLVVSNGVSGISSGQLLSLIGKGVTLAELLEVRLIVEGAAAQLAAARANDKDMEALSESLIALENMRQSNPGARPGGKLFREAAHFHRAIVAAAGNRMLVRLHEAIRSELESSRQWAGTVEQYPTDEMMSDHRELYEMIARRDTEGAGLTMRRHIERAKELAKKASSTTDSST